MPSGVYKRTPETRAILSKANRNSDAIKAKNEAMSEIITNSEAAKIQADKMRGGNDICNHHYIYDHDDLSKHTMKMTRSDHQKLHNLLRKLGYKVPHINR